MKTCNLNLRSCWKITQKNFCSVLRMNERSKLLDVIRHYLSFDVEMDYMAVFASFLSSEDSSVRCACELLYYISSQEYPDLRHEIPVRNLVTDIKDIAPAMKYVDSLSRVGGDLRAPRNRFTAYFRCVLIADRPGCDPCRHAPLNIFHCRIYNIISF